MMTVYYVKSQNPNDERVFTLVNGSNDQFEVDIFTDGETGLTNDATDDEYYNHLKSFVGTYIDIPELHNWRYFSHGKITKVTEKDFGTPTKENDRV